MKLYKWAFLWTQLRAVLSTMQIKPQCINYFYVNIPQNFFWVHFQANKYTLPARKQRKFLFRKLNHTIQYNQVCRQDRYNLFLYFWQKKQCQILLIQLMHCYLKALLLILKLKYQIPEIIVFPSHYGKFKSIKSPLYCPLRYSNCWKLVISYFSIYLCML